MPGVPTSVALLAMGTASVLGTVATTAISSSAAASQAEAQRKQQAQESAKQAEMMKKLQGNAPTPGGAQAAAKKEMDRKRRMASLAGGKTLLTSEGTPTATGGKSLLGS